MTRFHAPIELRKLESLMRDISNSRQLPAKLNFHVVSNEEDVPPECEISGHIIPLGDWGKVINWCIVLTED